MPVSNPENAVENVVCETSATLSRPQYVKFCLKNTGHLFRPHAVQGHIKYSVTGGC